VLSFNELSGKLSYERVESTYQKYRDTIITIHAYGTFIETTTEHPFFVKGEWRRADALKTGMSLTLASGEEAAIEKVEMRLERTAVYNFSVANNHTYTVGNVQFLVHNCDGKINKNWERDIYETVKNYSGKTYRVGKHEFRLDKTSVQHIFQRHHPDFWDGSVKKSQSFIPKDWDVSDVEKAVSQVLGQNYNKINARGSNTGMFQVEGTYKGKTVVVGFKDGKVGQLYTKE